MVCLVNQIDEMDHNILPPLLEKNQERIHIATQRFTQSQDVTRLYYLERGTSFCTQSISGKASKLRPLIYKAQMRGRSRKNKTIHKLV